MGSGPFANLDRIVEGKSGDFDVEIKSDIESFSPWSSKGFQVKYDNNRPIDIQFVFNQTIYQWAHSQEHPKGAAIGFDKKNLPKLYYTVKVENYPHPIKKTELIKDRKEVANLLWKYMKPDLSEVDPKYHAHWKGERLFVEGELEVVCAFENDKLDHPLYGTSNLTFVGRWRFHKEPNLWVRFYNSLGMCLAQEKDGYDSWFYQWRGDCDEEKGFLNTGEMGQISLPGVKKAYQLAKKFSKSLDAYMRVAEARM